MSKLHDYLFELPGKTISGAYIVVEDGRDVLVLLFKEGGQFRVPVVHLQLIEQP